MEYDMQVIPRIKSKPMYAYSDSFESLGDPANKEYYLASIFTHIHMQQNGNLNLLGMLSTQFFFRDFLNKYGITVHVFKHGEYKNSPNIFTETRLNRAHRENVTNLTADLNDNICTEITNSRSKALLTSWLKQNNKKYRKTTSTSGGNDIWKRIHESGNFPALTAWKAGLIDYIPRRDPLPDLVESNEKDQENKDAVKSTWKVQETNFDKFQANETIDLRDYAKQIGKRKKAQKRKEKWLKYRERHPMLAKVLSSMGMGIPAKGEESSTPKKEKVALLYAHGDRGITHATAQKLVKSIRKIRKDPNTKCVVLRINSPGGSIVACETISQELKGLKVPFVVSFGNVAASGGYYISAGADRIFASNKTVTGSIGIFGIRLDLTELARQYGVTVDHVATSDLSGLLDPFHPMTRKMKKNIADAMDRGYSQFKDVVADGRNMSPDNVEAIAKGRVWSGRQAKDNGLVDELGGLHRAIAYAKRSYATQDAEVVVWPHKPTYWERLLEAVDQNDVGLLQSTLLEYLGWTADRDKVELVGNIKSPVDWILSNSSKGLPGTLSGVVLAADENAAIRCLFEELGDRRDDIDPFPASFWE